MQIAMGLNPMLEEVISRPEFFPCYHVDHPTLGPGRHNINTGMFLASLSLAELLLLVVYIPLEVEHFPLFQCHAFHFHFLLFFLLPIFTGRPLHFFS